MSQAKPMWTLGVPVDLAVDELDVHLGHRGSALTAQNITISLMLMSGTPGVAGGLDLGAQRQQAGRVGGAFIVYCAVAASDSRMRRAIRSRMLDICVGRRAQVARRGSCRRSGALARTS